MQQCLKICGLNVSIAKDSEYFFQEENYRPFYMPYETDAEISVRLNLCNYTKSLPLDYLKLNTTYITFNNGLKKYLQWDKLMLTGDRRSCHSWMTANEDWSEVDIYANFTPIPLFLENNYLISAFDSRLSSFNGLFMHGSIVEHEGKAVVFTASSGVGKSTQAELWAKCFGDRILNGDRAALRIEENTVYAYGSPWSGSSPYVVNRRAPLSAIIVLKQASDNSIKKLNALESLEFCATHCYYPAWSKTLTANCMGTLDEILKKTPVYLLNCKPEKEAAILVRNTVFQGL